MAKTESRADISPALVKKLRRETSAGWMDCKKALQASSGDMDEAEAWLRRKGLFTAGKKAVREAVEGLVVSYIHGQGRIGVLLEVNTETDFSAHSEIFRSFVKDLSLHIAAFQPLYIREGDIPSAARQKEQKVFEEEARSKAKNDEIARRMAEGLYKKWLSRVCLLKQVFVRQSEETCAASSAESAPTESGPETKPQKDKAQKAKQTVEQALTDLIAKIGENIVIRRFACFVLGGAVEKTLPETPPPQQSEQGGRLV